METLEERERERRGERLCVNCEAVRELKVVMVRVCFILIYYFVPFI